MFLSLYIILYHYRNKAIRCIANLAKRACCTGLPFSFVQSPPMKPDIFIVNTSSSIIAVHMLATPASLYFNPRCSPLPPLLCSAQLPCFNHV